MFAVKFFIVYFVPIIIGVMCLFYRKSSLLYTFSMGIALLIMTICKESYDIDNYRWAYDNNVPHGKEPIYDILQNTCVRIGLSFDTFRFLFLFFTILFIYMGLKRYSEYCTLMMGMFILAPFLFGFITQMRGALAGSIVIFAIPFLFTKNKKDTVKYLLFICIAATIHVSVLFFLIFLIPKIIRINIVKYRIVCLSTALLLSVLVIAFFENFDSYTHSLVNEASGSFFNSVISRAVSYIGYEGRPNIKGYLFNVTKQLFCYVAAVVSFNKLKNGERNEKINEAIRVLDTFILFIPCYSISYQLMRIFYYSLPLHYYFIAEYTGNQLKCIPKGRPVTSQIVFGVFSMIVFYIGFGIWDTPEDFIRLINGVNI